MKKSITINLIGGPGSGKSTCAAGLFYNLKKMGINCELITEYAKDKVWEESLKVLDNQFYVFGKQHQRMFRTIDKVDVIITDSPLLNSIIYDKSKSEYFEKLIVEQYNKFNNLMFFIKRSDNTYQKEGRLQTRKEAEEIDENIKDMMHRNNIHYVELSCDIAVNYITKMIEEHYKYGLKII
jgi:nicotinamide riboside kinase